MKLALNARYWKSRFFDRDLSHPEDTVRLLTALKDFNLVIPDSMGT